MRRKKEKDRTPENKEPSRIALKDRDVRWRLRALISHASKDVKYSQRRYEQIHHRQAVKNCTFLHNKSILLSPLSPSLTFSRLFNY